MSVTAFNRRRRELAKQKAQEQAAAEDQKPAEPSKPARKRTRKPDTKQAETE